MRDALAVGYGECLRLVYRGGRYIGRRLRIHCVAQRTCTAHLCVQELELLLYKFSGSRGKSVQATVRVLRALASLDADYMRWDKGQGELVDMCQR